MNITRLALACGIVIAMTGGAGNAVISEKPDTPVFVDECGSLSDSYSYVEPMSGRWEWSIAEVTNPDGSFEQVILRAVAIDPYVFRGADKKRVWSFTYTNDAPCA